MPPATQNGSQAEADIYVDFSFSTYPANTFYDENEEPFTEDLFNLFKDHLLEYIRTRKIVAITKGKSLSITKGNKVTKNKVLAKAYFVDERIGAEYSKPILYNAKFSGKSYKGFADH